jgi:serine/threonine protein phosphatase 1
VRRPRTGIRAALDAAAIPTFDDRFGQAGAADQIRFVQAPGWMPAGRRAYVIGDIHGCRDALVALHRMVAADLAARPIRSAELVHLGDYIDQGPDSAGVIEHLLQDAPIPCVNLLGDHERMLLDALDGDRAAATDWLWAGGKAALVSWVLSPDLPREHWPSALPQAHIAWLRGLALTHQQGDYLFVHAGIRPGIPLADQSRDDLLSIRQPFLSTDRDFGVVVVHGHSAGPAASVTNNRIGLDTGAGLGGKLTCAVLEDDRLGLMAAGG